jgi:hypothetical protein
MARPLFPKLPESINYTFGVTFAVDDVAVQLEGFEVPPGASVYVRGLPSNTVPAFVATRPDWVSDASRRSALGPTTAVPFPVANLREIWAAGKAGEGVQVQVMGSPR